MIAVIFEVWPKDGHREPYLRRAAALKHHLSDIPGFISVERFQSLTQEGKLLSLSFFRDEAAVAEWRALAEHRAAQSRGRAGIFANYRLRVASVLRDYGMSERAETPKDSLDSHG